MNSTINIFFSSAGRRVELINCFREDAQSLGIEVKVIAGDHNPTLSAACRLADEAIGFPPCHNPNFNSEIERVCVQKDVRLLIPTIDTELLPLANLSTRLRSLGVLTAISNERVIKIARDKQKTAQVLSEVGVPTPGTLPLTELERALDCWGLPLIVKPNDGSNSVGIINLKYTNDIKFLPSNRSNYIVQKYITGREFTVNFFLNQNSEIISMVPHERMEVRGGEVTKARTIDLPQLDSLAPKLQAALVGGFGPMCFQGILTPNDELIVFEINARFGGGYPLTHRAGARFSKWLLESSIGRTPTSVGEWRRDVTMLRYDAAVFV